MQAGDLITPLEAGELLGFKESTMHAAARDGRLPCVRLWRGKRKAALRFSRSQLQEHIDKCSVPAKPRR